MLLLLLLLLVGPDHGDTRRPDGQGQLGGAVWRGGKSLVENEYLLAAMGGLDDGGVEREVDVRA
jgi:hypothetical protein